ncbi:hypothetical protein ElyMa_000855900 [Elysia marginata]|uniref:G-protein coupled receptors family 1 profile domain-containing protein n=1 Tax=Elysia marginata TaxID=1093978 RepID=A0AAV4H2P4_9GAST|nr:hypothetical protein ElyMa_000855900 [Elysia marginata]
MRGRIIVLRHKTPSQESKSSATNCIYEAAKSVAVLGSIDILTLWQMSKRITPFASQNTVAITLAADLCILSFFWSSEKMDVSSHGVALCLWGIQVDPSFITSNQIVK